MRLLSSSLFCLTGLSLIPTNADAAQHRLLRNGKKIPTGGGQQANHVITHTEENHQKDDEHDKFYDRMLLDGEMSMVLMDSSALDFLATDIPTHMEDDIDEGDYEGGTVDEVTGAPADDGLAPLDMLPPCAAEFQECSDGTVVAKGAPSCEWESCPVGSCLMDTIVCEDGTRVYRDPANNCEHGACPPSEDHECPDAVPSGECEGDHTCNYNMVTCCDGIEQGYADFASCVDNQWIVMSAFIACPEECSEDDTNEDGPNPAEPDCPEEVPSMFTACEGEMKTCNYNLVTCCDEEQGYSDIATCEDDMWIVISALIQCPEEC